MKGLKNFDRMEITLDFQACGRITGGDHCTGGGFEQHFFSSIQMTFTWSWSGDCMLENGTVLRYGESSEWTAWTGNQY